MISLNWHSRSAQRKMCMFKDTVLLHKISCASCERLTSLVFRLRRTLTPLVLDTRTSRSGLFLTDRVKPSLWQRLNNHLWLRCRTQTKQLYFWYLYTKRYMNVQFYRQDKLRCANAYSLNFGGSVFTTSTTMPPGKSSGMISLFWFILSLCSGCQTSMGHIFSFW